MMRSVWLPITLGSLFLALGCSISRPKEKEKAPPVAVDARKDKAAHTIVISSDVNHATVHQFVKGHGRAATREELLELHRVWIDDEILFREGSKLGGETSDRPKVVARALEQLDQKLEAAPATEAELRRWFEAHRDQYEQPQRFDFEDAPLTSSTEAEARKLVAALNDSTPPGAAEGVRSFQKRPVSNLVQSYGPEVAAAFAQADADKWFAVRARDGWRVMRVLARIPATHAVFEQQRETVRQELALSTLVEKRAAAVHALWNDYDIVLEEPLDCLADK